MINNPYVGPFFFINGKLYSLKISVDKGEDNGLFINHPTSHFEFFKQIKPGDDYGHYSRGRVIYSKKNNQFYLYLDKSLVDNNALINETIKEYNLTNSDVLIKLDEHYTHDKTRDMTKLDSFISEIKNSLPDNGYECKNISTRGKKYYFENKDYGDALKACFDKKEIDSKEFNGTPHYPYYKICSVSSSARLCFLYFINKGNVEFEVQLPNPLGGNPAQPDAKIGNTYYECKCQEIVDGEKETLLDGYNEFLNYYFGITKLGNLKDMGVNYDKDYDKTHFNVKQLFTHLIAIAENNKDTKEEITLQYIFFTPKEELQSESTKRVYKELKEEIAAIWESDMMKNFYKKCPNIKLGISLFEPVDQDCFALDPKELLMSL